MGLFTKKDICCICNNGEGTKKLLDGMICKECIQNGKYFLMSSELKNTSSERAKEAIKASIANEEKLRIFQNTKKIDKFIEIDEEKKLFKLHQVVYSYDDVITYELIKNGESITKGGIGRAVVGGLLFGGTGAIVGGVTGSKKTKEIINEFKIKIVTKNKFHPETYIFLLPTGPVKSGSILFKSYSDSAQSILSQLAIMVEHGKNNIKDVKVSSADEIVKYKKLYDEGIITQEEFEAKKKQLLEL